MENSIQNIEWINDYLNKKLSKNEVEDFESRLKTDTLFNKEFKDHVLFLEGLKRQQLKADIKNAKQIYVKTKWFKYLGFGFGVLVLIVALISYMNTDKPHTELTNPTKNEKPKSVKVLDSVSSINVIEDISIEDTIVTKQSEINEVVEIREISSKKGIEIPKKRPETFTINHDKDTTIICKEGTELTIKRNTFVNKGKNIVSGKITLKATEYYQLSDILLANLSTQSEGKLLETGGMLNLQAHGGDELLSLRQGAHIDIYFPTKKKNMQLFSGAWNNGIINWTLAESYKDLEPVIEEIEAVDEDVDVPFSVVEEAPVYPGCENLSKTATKKCTSKAISNFVRDNFNTEIAKNLGMVGRQRITSIFKINKNGDIVDARFRSNDPELEKEANRVIARLPKMLPGKQRGKAVSVPYSLPIIFEVDGVVNASRSSSGKRRRDSLYTKRFEARLKGKDTSQVTASEVSGYILRTSKLGWINCDRFRNWKNKINYKLIIEDAKGSMRVSMVFKSINTVLPSWQSGKLFDFKMVPNNEEIVLIAVKEDEGKIYLDIVEAKTVDNPNVEFNFKEVNLEELKKALKKLNKLF